MINRLTIGTGSLIFLFACVFVCHGADCSIPGTSISMPSHTFHAGDLCELRVVFCNTGSDPLYNHPLFVVLTILGEYWFAPEWTRGEDGFTHFTLTFPPGTKEQLVLPEFSWPVTGTSFSGALFIAAVTDPVYDHVVGDIASWEFSWSDW